MKWLKRLFSKVEVRHLVFNMRTDEREHYEFIEWVNKSDVEIINSFTTYHKVSNSHIPAYIHYIVKVRNI